MAVLEGTELITPSEPEVVKAESAQERFPDIKVLIPPASEDLLQINSALARVTDSFARAATACSVTECDSLGEIGEAIAIRAVGLSSEQRATLIETLQSLACFVDRAKMGYDADGHTIHGESYALLLASITSLAGSFESSIGTLNLLPLSPSETPAALEGTPDKSVSVTTSEPARPATPNEVRRAEKNSQDPPRTEEGISQTHSIDKSQREQAVLDGKITAEDRLFFERLAVTDAQIVTSQGGELMSLERWLSEQADAGKACERSWFYRERGDIPDLAAQGARGRNQADCDFPVSGSRSTLPLSPEFRIVALTFHDASGNVIKADNARLEECVFGGASVTVPDGAARASYRIERREKEALPSEALIYLRENLPRFQTYRSGEDLEAYETFSALQVTPEEKAQVWLTRARQQDYYYCDDHAVVEYLNSGGAATNEIMLALKMGTCLSLAAHECRELVSADVPAVILAGYPPSQEARQFQVSPGHAQCFIVGDKATLIHDLTLHCKDGGQLAYSNVSPERWESARAILQTGTMGEISEDASRLRSELLPSQPSSGSGDRTLDRVVIRPPASRHSWSEQNFGDGYRENRKLQKLADAIELAPRARKLDALIEEGLAKGSLKEAYAYQDKHKFPFISSYEITDLPENLRWLGNYSPHATIREATLSAARTFAGAELQEVVDWAIADRSGGDKLSRGLKLTRENVQSCCNNWKLPWSDLLHVVTPSSVTQVNERQLSELLARVAVKPVDELIGSLHPESHRDYHEEGMDRMIIKPSERVGSTTREHLQLFLEKLELCTLEAEKRLLKIPIAARLDLLGNLAVCSEAFTRERIKYGQSSFDIGCCEQIDRCISKLLDLPGQSKEELVLEYFRQARPFFGDALAGFLKRAGTELNPTRLGMEISRMGFADPNATSRVCSYLADSGCTVNFEPFKAEITNDALAYINHNRESLRINFPSADVPCSSIVAKLGATPDAALARAIVMLNERGGLDLEALRSQWPARSETEVAAHAVKTLDFYVESEGEPFLRSTAGEPYGGSPRVPISSLPALLRATLAGDSPARAALHYLEKQPDLVSPLDDDFRAMSTAFPEKFEALRKKLSVSKRDKLSMVFGGEENVAVERLIARRLLGQLSPVEKYEATIWLNAVHLALHDLNAGNQDFPADSNLARRQEKYRKKRDEVAVKPELNVTDFDAILFAAANNDDLITKIRNFEGQSLREEKIEIPQFYEKRLFKEELVIDKQILDLEIEIPEKFRKILSRFEHLVPSEVVLDEKITPRAADEPLFAFAEALERAIAEGEAGPEVVQALLEEHIPGQADFERSFPGLSSNAMASAILAWCAGYQKVDPGGNVMSHYALDSDIAHVFSSSPSEIPRDRRDPLTRHLDASVYRTFDGKLKLDEALEEAVIKAQRLVQAPLRPVSSPFLHYVSESSGRRAPSSSSGEFVDRTPYVPGDDVRRIDWKMYARTDQLYTMKFKEDIRREVVIITDLEKLADAYRQHSNDPAEQHSSPALSELFLQLTLARREGITPTVVLRYQGVEIERFEKPDALPGKGIPVKEGEVFFQGLRECLLRRVPACADRENFRRYTIGEQNHQTRGLLQGLAKPIPEGALVVCNLTAQYRAHAIRAVETLARSGASLHLTGN